MSLHRALLGDVMSFIRGVTFKPDDRVKPFTPGSTVVMRTKNVQFSGLDQQDLIAIPSNLIKREDQNLFEGDILISSANSWELVGKSCYVPKLDYLATAGGFISIVRAKKGVIDNRYLYHWITKPSTQHTIRNCGRQTTNISNLDVGQFKNIEIPLPSLSEQRRIANVLDKADSIRLKRQRSIKLADEFLRAVFLNMFGDPVTNPKGWKSKPIGDICACIVPGRDKPKSFTGKTPWITTNELKHLNVTRKKENFIGLSDEEISEVRAKVVPSGSVVMTCVGDLGIVSIAGEDMVINQQLHAFLKSSSVTSSFLCYALASQKTYMLRMASTTTVPYMNKTVCNSIPIILPPIDLQEKFETIVEKTRKNLAVMEYFASLGLFESISQKLFSE